ncbi:3',5'-cyclic adenosine monophosphate phosphodiesterase CpdA [Oxobacter pfennigii]|uniref:3',5'-cyclic adenosine monophosphate phosphodiesterase CpdA n=1 Tax=Oxobacter pfennigii TaxID=36849 RepID=A0A0P8YEA5_9CLOT|nr:metallophosphoesterase [Oxobacter pfennigii]KPU45538.1 3',5'-cyclic adenosine monophosphate phosphodiesterase CpdA [Oxobacter pfennigii]
MRFIIISDCKGKNNGINKEILTKIFKQTVKLQPQFIVALGDTVAGHPDEDVLIFQLKHLKKLIYKYHPDITVYPVAGNHEIGSRSNDDRYEKAFSSFYGDFALDSSLQGYNNLVYFKDFEHVRLIILNTFRFRSAHKIDEAQLNFLEAAASIEKKYKLLFFHSPAFPTGAHYGNCLDLHPDYRNLLWSIVDKHKIHVVFSAHEHNYTRRLIDNSFLDGNFKNPIYQVITGGGGEKLRDKYISSQGVIIPPIARHHFVLVDAEGDGLNVYAMDLKGTVMDEFVIKK